MRKMTNYFANFNSIKVQLKPKAHVKEYLKDRFQFHKGTIKTLRKR